MSEYKARLFCSGKIQVVYVPDVKRLLDTIDALRDQLRYTHDTMTSELVFHTACKCDVASGDTPCAHCAAVHFHTWYQANLLQNEP